MNEEPNKPLEAVGDAELEARVVAWVLGEASSFEAAELERRCRECPELELFAKRMRGVHGWLKEAEKVEESHDGGGEWKLAPERRERVMVALGVEAVDSGSGRLRKVLMWRAFFSLAACGVALLVMDQMLVKRVMVKSSVSEAEIKLSALAAGDVREEVLVENAPAGVPAPASAVAMDMPVDGLEVFGDRAKVGADRARGLGGIADEALSDQKNADQDPFAPAPAQAKKPASLAAPLPMARGSGKDALAEVERKDFYRWGGAFEDADPFAGGVPMESESKGKKELEELGGRLKRNLADEGLVAKEQGEREQRDVSRFKAMEKSSEWGNGDAPGGLANSLEAPSRRDARLPEAQVAEIATVDAPESTFSLHVSDASFQVARAAIQAGQRPAPEAVRVEEIYNGVDYGDPGPTDGQPVVGVTDQMAHPGLPERNLLRVGLRTGSAGRGVNQNLNLTVLVDHSGSMEREDRREGVKVAVQELSGLLKPGDVVSVVGFARQPRLLVDRLPGDQAAKLPEIISQAVVEGGTNLEEGLRFGNALAERQFTAGAQNRVVLFTDGAANLGDVEPEKLDRVVQNMRQQGIAFDAAGFGASGLNDRLLEQVTRSGNGRYYVVDRPDEAGEKLAKKLAGAFQPAAENVKVQVRFNSKRVKGYRLLGFEEHLLRPEDFRNDRVDAAELGADEAGQALYQIHVMPDGEGEVGEVRVRFWDVASQQMIERSWAIPYEPQVASWEQAKSSMQLAGLAALLGGKLKNDATFAGITDEQVVPIVAKVKQAYPVDRRVQDLIGMLENLR